jgi:hypothetical protein
MATAMLSSGTPQEQSHQSKRSSSLTLISYLTYISTLKMEATCSSETSVDFQWPICHVPEDRTLQFYYLLNVTLKILYYLLHIKWDGVVVRVWEVPDSNLTR